jgi:hypothetical protein
LHVQSLSITFLGGHNRSSLGTLSVLQACPKIEWLVLRNMSRNANSRIATALNDLRGFLTSPSISPRHLYITTNLFSNNQVQFSYPIFQNVTHLTVVWRESHGRPEDEVRLRWDALGNLKNLTHMSLYPAARPVFFKTSHFGWF